MGRMMRKRSWAFLITLILIIMQTETAFASESANTVSADNLNAATAADISADTLSLNTAEVTSESEVSADAADTSDASAVEPTSAELAVSNELFATVDGLSGLTESVDYQDDQAYFTADSEEKAEEVASDYGASLDSYAYGVAVIKFDNGESLSDNLTAAAESCSADTLVHPDFIRSTEAVSAPDDPYYSEQWFHDPVNDLEAWNITEGSGVKVAVLDTGISLSHPDLAANIVGSVNVADIGSSAEDDNGHGSNVAGIIAAVADNGAGVAGIAPQAGIYAIKVAGSDGTLDTSSSIRGIKAAIEAGADVINMSYGSTGSAGYSQDEQDAINDAVAAGITVVAAAGNGSNNNGVATNTVNYPAAYSNVIAVAAYQSDNTLAYFSNYGSWVDIAAPGVDMLSCYKNSKYAKESGTSQASPSAAAVCALIYAARPSLISANNSAAVSTVTDILKKSENSTTYTYTGKNGSHSVKGGIDAQAAAELAAGTAADTVSHDTASGNTVSEDTDSGLYVTAISSNEGSTLYVAPGRSITIAATVTPSTAKNKKIKWTIDQDSNYFSVNSSGRVSCSRTAPIGAVCTIKGTAADGHGAVTILDISAVTPTTEISIADEQRKIRLATAETVSPEALDTSCQLSVESDGQGLYRYSSSNKKVVTVGSTTGLITAVGKGTATVTVMALDGSNKKAASRVTVIAPVTDITCTFSNGAAGTSSPIGTGCSIRIAAKARSANSGNATNASLIWSVVSGSGITVKNGLVKCDRYAAAGTAVISCVPKDGYGLVSRQFTFTIYPKTISMGITQNGTYASTAAIAEETGDTVLFSELGKNITVTPADSYADDFQWIVAKSSRYDITYDPSGEPSAVTIKKKGNISVYAKAMDGSGKKVRFLLKAE